MAGDDTARLVAVEAAAALQQRVADKMDTKKKSAEVHVCVCAITLLLEEDQDSIAALEVKVVVAALQLTPTTPSSSSALPPHPPGVMPPSSPCSTRRSARYIIFALLSQLFWIFLL
jgi:hypothetical protein